MVISCPYCGNAYSIMSQTNNMYYCPKCCFYFNESEITSNASTAAIENNISIYHIPDAADAARGFYTIESKGSNFLQLPEYDKLIINAKDIIINNDKISVTIDKDNIDKFNAIEINGVKFVRENN